MSRSKVGAHLALICDLVLTIAELLEALQSYASHLESSFLRIRLPPTTNPASLPPDFDLSPAYIDSIDKEFTRVYEEYNNRVENVRMLAEETVKLWAELGTPQAQTDSSIVENWRDSPEQLGLHQDDISNLQRKRDGLIEEKRTRERKLKELRSTVEGLWLRLEVNESDRKAVLSKTRGCGLRAINELEDELSRLNELKRQNLHLFVEEARSKLQALWDELYFSEEEAVEFTPMFCDVFSDALLSAHEAEIARLQVLKQQRAPTLELIAKHRSIMQDKTDLAASSQDASRLLAKNSKGEKRDPTRLLREEKMRKRIARELPKVEAELTKVLDRWEDEYGRPFLVFGERYLDNIAETSSSKAPPPRSKTPSIMGTSSHSSTARPAVGTHTSQPARPPSTLRSKTPVANASVGKMPSTATAKSQRIVPPISSPNKSPSRIPARVPLGGLADPSNSPGRKAPRAQTRSVQLGQENRVAESSRQMMAPPPKMRDIFAPPKQSRPQLSPSNQMLHEGLQSIDFRHQVAPEDPYVSDSGEHNADHETVQSHSEFFQKPAISRKVMQPHPSMKYDYTDTPLSAYHSKEYARQPNDHASDTTSRQTSITSSVAASIVSHQTNATTVSSSAGSSENWEAFDSDGENEMRALLSKHGYQQQHDFGSQPENRKRAFQQMAYTPVSIAYGTTKKARPIQGYPTMSHAGMETLVNGQRVASVEGSDAGWTDESVQ